MKKITQTIIIIIAATGFLAAVAAAQPVMLTDSQMDTIAAGGVEKVDGFVCPVIPVNLLEKTGNGKFFSIGNGYYSFHGPDVSVPVHATNANGAGRPGPGGPGFSVPGDTDYTAIWGFRP